VKFFISLITFYSDSFRYGNEVRIFTDLDPQLPCKGVKYFAITVVLRLRGLIFVCTAVVYLFQIAEQEMPGIMALRHKAKEDKPLKGARFVKSTYRS